MFQDLPQEVLEFLGKPMSSASLIELAKHDNLDIIYTPQSTSNEPIMTRSKSEHKREIEEAYALQQALEDADYLDNEDGPIIEKHDRQIRNSRPIPMHDAQKLETIVEEE